MALQEMTRDYNFLADTFTLSHFQEAYGTVFQKQITVTLLKSTLLAVPDIELRTLWFLIWKLSSIVIRSTPPMQSFKLTLNILIAIDQEI